MIKWRNWWLAQTGNWIAYSIASIHGSCWGNMVTFGAGYKRHNQLLFWVILTPDRRPAIRFIVARKLVGHSSMSANGLYGWLDAQSRLFWVENSDLDYTYYFNAASMCWVMFPRRWRRPKYPHVEATSLELLLTGKLIISNLGWVSNTQFASRALLKETDYWCSKHLRTSLPELYFKVGSLATKKIWHL